MTWTVTETGFPSGGSSTNQAAYNMPSATYATGKLYKVTVSSLGLAAVDPAIPTLTLAGLTFTQRQTILTSAAEGGRRTTVWTAIGNVTGNINIDWGAEVQSAVQYKVVQVENDAGTPEFVQVSPDTDQATSTAPTANLAAFADAGNLMLLWVSWRVAATTFAKDAAHTDLTGGAVPGGDNLAQDGAYFVGEDTTPSGTLSASTAWRAVALEIGLESEGTALPITESILIRYV
jgi:hypothetical protein